MLKCVKDRVWAFDVEWIPDPLAGRLLYALPPALTDPAEILEVMWREGGSSEEDPTPFLKTVVCRVVSIAAVERSLGPDGEPQLQLKSLPRDPDDPTQVREAHVVGTFLDALGARQPQLVGFNSIASDLKILVQRAVILGLQAEGFCRRPEKPWLGVDYFARGSDHNVDLKEILGGFGKVVPTLHEIAVQSGIPGKMDVDGNQVAKLWLDGELRRIVEYNELDALTTYLVWLRVAHFAGQFSTARYVQEQAAVRALIENELKRREGAHLEKFLGEWERLSALVAERD
ncbi:MAG: 3'-5' exonuclease [Myxococcota bacterium]